MNPYKPTMSLQRVLDTQVSFGLLLGPLVRSFGSVKVLRFSMAVAVPWGRTALELGDGK